MTGKPKMRVRIGDDDLFMRETVVRGRDAWMLRELLKGGARGVTTAELPPGVRASHYIMKLRRAGIAVETVEERHGGVHSGRHGRYVLTVPVTILEGADT